MIARRRTGVAYWVYENWTAEHKAVVHMGNCGNCNDGLGCHTNRLGEKNGRWHGPFDTLSAADKAAKTTGRPTRQHRCAK